MTSSIIAVALWIACGIWAGGRLFAFEQGEYPVIAQRDYIEDRAFSCVIALTGPVGLIPVLIVCRPSHGWRWR